MLWLKAFHIVFVVAWFAGLFYLPRLFVYHVDADASTRARLLIMERRLFGIMTLGAVLAIAFASGMLVLVPGYLKLPWMHVKLMLVVLLIGYHLWCYRLMLAFRSHQNTYSERWYRWFNEVPTVLLIGIVILVVVKPF